MGDIDSATKNTVCATIASATLDNYFTCDVTGRFLFVVVQNDYVYFSELEAFGSCACPTGQYEPAVGNALTACVACPSGSLSKLGSVGSAACQAIPRTTAAPLGITQLVRYSFANSWGCNLQADLPAAQIMSGAAPNQVLNCAVVPGAVYVKQDAPCQFACDENYTRTGETCTRVCGNVTAAVCEPSHFASAICNHAGYTLYQCESCAYAAGQQALPWSVLDPTACPTTPCAAGTQGTNGVCAPCANNTFSAAGSATCSPCARGTFALAGSSECSTCFEVPSEAPCAAGTVATHTVADVDAYFARTAAAGHNVTQHKDLFAFCHAGGACLPCLPGEFEQASACVPCDFAHYQPNFQSPRCFECGAGHNTSARGSLKAADCHCQPGFE